MHNRSTRKYIKQSSAGYTEIMTTPSNDRVLLISGIAVNAASIVAIAAPLANLPDGVRFAAVGLVGVTATGLAWKFVTVDRAALARRLLLISCVLVTLLGAVLAWPGGPPVGSSQEDRSAEQKADGGTEQSSKNSSTEAKLTETVAQLKRGIQQPPRDSDVHSCITVSGDGRVPDGYGLWVANLPDVGGSADMGALNNLQRVNQADGGTLVVANPELRRRAGQARCRYGLLALRLPAPRSQQQRLEQPEDWDSHISHGTRRGSGAG